MTRLVFALGLLTVSLCVAPPARADFAVVRFNSIWTDTAGGPQDGQFVVFRVHHHQFDRFHTREPAGESATVGGLAACLPNKLSQGRLLSNFRGQQPSSAWNAGQMRAGVTPRRASGDTATWCGLERSRLCRFSKRRVSAETRLSS